MSCGGTPVVLVALPVCPYTSDFSAIFRGSVSPAAGIGEKTGGKSEAGGFQASGLSRKRSEVSVNLVAVGFYPRNERSGFHIFAYRGG